MKTYKVSRPRLELQGSDALLKRQHRFITRGEIGFIQVKHLTSALPEKGERPTKTSKRFTMDVGKATKKKKSDQTQLPGDNLRECTWSSARPC